MKGLAWSYSTIVIMWLPSLHLATHLQLGSIAKSPVIMWSLFAILSAGFPRKLMGETLATNVLSYYYHLLRGLPLASGAWLQTPRAVNTACQNPVWILASPFFSQPPESRSVRIAVVKWSSHMTASLNDCFTKWLKIPISVVSTWQLSRIWQLSKNLLLTYWLKEKDNIVTFQMAMICIINSLCQIE